jgi:hypothetical protein
LSSLFIIGFLNRLTLFNWYFKMACLFMNKTFKVDVNSKHNLWVIVAFWHIKVWGGRLCHLLTTYYMIWSFGDDHTLIIMTKMCLISWFVKIVESVTPDPNVMEWSCPCLLCWVCHLAHTNRLAGTLPNIMGRGLTIW